MADAKRCRNCDLCCSEVLCRVCNCRRRCQYCLRRLPAHSFNDDDVDVCKVSFSNISFISVRNIIIYFLKCNLGLFFKPYICCNYFVVVWATPQYNRSFPQTHSITRCIGADTVWHDEIQLDVRRTIKPLTKRYRRRTSDANTTERVNVNSFASFCSSSNSSSRLCTQRASLALSL